MKSFKMVRLVVDDVAAAFPRLTINCQMHEAKSQTGSWALDLGKILSG